MMKRLPAPPLAEAITKPRLQDHQYAASDRSRPKMRSAMTGFRLIAHGIHLKRALSRLTTPSSATPGWGRGCEHAGARRRRGLCRASWRAAQPVTEPVGPPPRAVTERQSPEFAAALG